MKIRRSGLASFAALNLRYRKCVRMRHDIGLDGSGVPSDLDGARGSCHDACPMSKLPIARQKLQNPSEFQLAPTL
jgi:hypothetical protein